MPDRLCCGVEIAVAGGCRPDAVPERCELRTCRLQEMQPDIDSVASAESGQRCAYKVRWHRQS